MADEVTYSTVWDKKVWDSFGCKKRDLIPKQSKVIFKRNHLGEEEKRVNSGWLLMHSRENPINSSNQVIDSISPSAWSPNRSQEKGFPEAASVSRNGQMSFLSEVREGQIFRGQEMRLNAKTNNTASLWVCRLSSYHAIIAPSNTSHTCFLWWGNRKEKKRFGF